MDPHYRELTELGFVILQDFMSAQLLAGLRRRVDELFEQEGAQAGGEFKYEPNAQRLANVVDKGEIFERVIGDPVVLGYVREVIGPEFKLSSLNARTAPPHTDSRQPLHCDMAAIRDEKGYWVCNTVWMLDDFTTENGALRIVPRSHQWGKLPQDELAEPLAPHPDEMLMTAPAGTVVVMNAHLWHGGTENRTAAPRRALHAFYCRRDKPQQQYQKKLLREETQRRLSPELRRLLALDDPLNDELSTNVAVRSGFLK